MNRNPHLNELGEFLKARRAELTPSDVGLRGGQRRRVKGLRREEVALFAAMSTEYYARIEQGRLQASAPLLDGYPRPGRSVLFLGRFDEPRKGMDSLIGALPALVERFPDIEILIVGRGDEDELREEAGQLAGHLHFLGQVDDAAKASAMRSADVYCAPNTGGESFGIVLVEAMAAGTAVVASDLDAFRRVLEDGKAGRLVPVDDGDGLAAGLIEVLENDAVRERFIDAAAGAVRQYDWSVVAGQILRVYETVAGAGAKVQLAGTAGRSVATGGVS